MHIRAELQPNMRPKTRHSTPFALALAVLMVGVGACDFSHHDLSGGGCKGMVPDYGGADAPDAGCRSPLPSLRAYFAAVTGLDGRIYVIGGTDGSYLAAVDAY